VTAIAIATLFTAFVADVPTTDGAVAIRNLDAQIERVGDDADAQELLLLRSRILSDYDALDRAVILGEAGDDLVQRARARAAVHRFDEALVDLDRAGAGDERMASLRASILVAVGRAGDVIRDPGAASRTALAHAYAAVGYFGRAESMYLAALGELNTTSPFPYALIHFARGVMWAERAGDRARGEAAYTLALAYLPQFVLAHVHLAELEVARGDAGSAMSRLKGVAASGEPEALLLLGELHIRAGDVERGRREIAEARRRFASLLGRYPSAFGHHAPRFDR
jgi:tetratricopeptide (TPR) repeat protein